VTATAARPALVLVANARLPSQRAQSLQVAQVAASFARAGADTTLLYAKRRDTPLRPAAELWDYYAVAPGARAEAEAVPCCDWIDALPRRLQYLPARLQELTFARRAARRVRKVFEGAFVLSRELETAHALRGRSGLFLELHRVPGGATRRRWLLEAARAVAGVVAISGGVRDDLVELGLDPQTITVAHDGFEPARFEGLPSRDGARVALDLPRDRQVVVYTGGLLEWKGVDVLVDAARSLPDVQFVIAGGMDADVRALRERAAGLEHVRIDGFQPPARVALYLAAADVGVVPNRGAPAISARYTSPLKVFEAMAVGLPLVVSDLPSLRDVLDPDNARFVAPDSAGALAEGLHGVLADDGGRAALGAALHERAGEHTWDARAKRLLKWMEARA
jgi:glycosyltransferase involved in cell wall biosynthesis